MSARAAWRLESLGFAHVYRYTPGKADWMAFELPWEGDLKQRTLLGDLAKRDVPTTTLDAQISAVRRQVEEAHWDLCVVVNDSRVVLGLLTEEALTQNSGQTVEAAMTPGPTTFRPDATLKRAAQSISQQELKYVLTTMPDGTLLGAVSCAEIAQAAEAEGDEEAIPLSCP